MNTLKNFVKSKVPDHIEFKIPFIKLEETKSLLTKLDITKAIGQDNIGPYFLKISADTLAPSITYLINLSILEGVFPSHLKVAKVHPIFKKGDKSLPGNYRPVSVLPTLSKIFEKHVTHHLYLYLSKYKLLSQCQSGFRSQHSCQTALTDIIDKWLKYMDDGKVIGAVFLDLKKAFDMINHDILCKKLELYKISNSSLKWFKSYLSERSQNVCIGNYISNPEPLESGVPQGSILGPILFILYINDLPLEQITSDIEMYADDTTLHYHDTNKSEIENVLNHDLNTIRMWCKNNKMEINPNKTTCMLIGSAQRKAKIDNSLHILIENQEITNVNVQKMLGIYIDHNLDWKFQVQQVIKNINSRLFLFSKIKLYLDKKCKILFYNSYILPIFDYCCIIWGNCNADGIEQLTKLQKRAARIILDAPFNTPSKELFKSLNWLSFRDRLIYHKLILVYKILNNKTPEYLQKYCVPNTNVHNRNLRSISNNNLVIVRPNTNNMKRSFAYSAPTLWNKMPLNVKLSSTLNSFKTNCFKYVFEQSLVGVFNNNLM